MTLAKIPSPTLYSHPSSDQCFCEVPYVPTSQLRHYRSRCHQDLFHRLGVGAQARLFAGGAEGGDDFCDGDGGDQCGQDVFGGRGAQARRSLAIVQGAIEALGGKITDVVRTRMFVTDVTQWEKVAVVHGEVFGNIRPATTIVEVARLIDAEALIEIEADAVIGSSGD